MECTHGALSSGPPRKRALEGSFNELVDTTTSQSGQWFFPFIVVSAFAFHCVQISFVRNCRGALLKRWDPRELTSDGDR